MAQRRFLQHSRIMAAKYAEGPGKSRGQFNRRRIRLPNGRNRRWLLRQDKSEDAQMGVFTSGLYYIYLALGIFSRAR